MDAHISMKRVIFDIETGPLPDEQLDKLAPEFSAPANYKDPEKIAAHIAQQRAEWKKDAAMSALTGRVLAIGIQVITPQGPMDVEIIGGDACANPEAAVLSEFWRMWSRPDLAAADWVGFNILGFDMPFLIRRSWVNRVSVPAGLRQQGRYWAGRLVDLRDVWLLGDYRGSGGLDAIARGLGLEGKNGDGAEFARLWVEDRTKAVEYLRQDINVTREVARVLLGGMTP